MGRDERQNEAQQEMMESRMEEFELATAYVPYQQWGKLYPPEEALSRGTIFPDLYRPYVEKN
jgi:hypothetical protein